MTIEAKPFYLRASLWAGVLAPVLFIVAVVAQDLLRSDSDPMRSWVSHLAIGPLGWMLIIPLVLLGLAMIAFWLGARVALRTPHNAAPTALLSLGVASVAAGIFVSDPPDGQGTGRSTRVRPPTE